MGDSEDDAEEVDHKLFNALHASASKGNIGKFVRLIATTRPNSHILRCHAPDDVSEKTTIPNSFTPKMPSTYSKLIVHRPTLLAAAVIHGQVGIVNEVVKIIASSPIGGGGNSLLDIGNEAYEVNFKGEIEWRAFAVTPLMLACMLDKEKCIERLLLAGADPNAKSSLGRTPLHETCFQGNLKTATLCLSYGSSLKATELEGASSLMLSCAKGAEDLMKFLLSKGADTRQVDSYDRNALFYALPSAPPNTVRQLIKFDRNCYVRDSDGQGAFLSSCKLARLDLVNLFINEADALGLQYNPRKADLIINEQDASGRNGLHIAAEIGSIELYTLLLSAGISIEPDLEGRSPLMLACLTNNVEFVEFLIEENPDGACNKLQHDAQGRNCLFYAVTNGDVALIDYLAQNGVPFEATASGLTALMQAAGKGKVDVINFLLENRVHYGLDINACDCDRWNAAMYAASIGNLPALEELVASGIDLGVTSDGRTVLMESAYHGHVKMTKFIVDTMLRRRADQSQAGSFDHCDDEGWNAAMYALAGPDPAATVEILSCLQAQADIKPCTSKRGVMPLMEVALKGNLNLVDYFLESFADDSPDMCACDDEGANALCYAALGGCLPVFKKLRTKGVPCVNDLQGRNLLMLAAARGHIDLVNYIAKNATSLGVSLDATDVHGRNALFYACSSNMTNLVGNLFELGVPASRDEDGATLLMFAAEAGRVDVVDWLLSNGKSNLNELDNRGRNVLFYALKSRDSAVVDKFLFTPGLSTQLGEIPKNSDAILCEIICRWLVGKEADSEKLAEILAKFSSPKLPLNTADEAGQPTLYYLAMEGKLRDLKKYAEFYDPESRNAHRHGVTLLMQACSSCLIDVARLLIDEAADVKALLEAEDAQGRTALTYATVSQRAPIVQLLIEKGAKLSIDNNGHSAVTYAVQARNLRIALLLMASVAVIEPEVGSARDAEGHNLLHYCARYGSNELLVKLIVQRTLVNINARTSSGCRTALMTAVVCGNVLVARALVELGCSLTACDSEAKTVLHLLFEEPTNQRKQSRRRFPVLTLAQLLLTSASSAAFLVSEPDGFGRTALMMACAGGLSEAAFLLLEHGANLEARDNHGKSAIDYCSEDNRQLQNFLKLALRPSPNVRRILEKFREEIVDVLDLEEIEENKDVTDLVVDKTAVASKCSVNYVYDDTTFCKLCNLVDTAEGGQELIAMLKSELYQETGRELFV